AMSRGADSSPSRGCRLFRYIPDAHCYVVPSTVLAAFGLCDVDDFAIDVGQPLVDVVFMRRIDERFTVTADEGEHFEALFHGCFSDAANTAETTLFRFRLAAPAEKPKRNHGRNPNADVNLLP